MQTQEIRAYYNLIAMKKIVFINLCVLFISCNLIEELGEIDFTQHVDSNNLRIFGKEDVSSEFLNKVAQNSAEADEIKSARQKPLVNTIRPQCLCVQPKHSHTE